MPYDVSNFTDYVDRDLEPITRHLFKKGGTGNFVRMMTGVKGKTSIPKVSGEAVLVKGNCPKDAQTEPTTLTEDFIEVVNWKVKKDYCVDTLQNKLPNEVLPSGSQGDEIPKPWEEKMIDTNLASINKTLEFTYWQGDTAGTYPLFDGFIKIIDADGNAIEGNPSGATSVTPTNIIGLVDDLIESADPDARDEESFAVVLGNDLFNMYMKALKDENQYHSSPENDGEKYRIIDSNVWIRKIRGLTGTNRMFAGCGTDFIIGMDVEGEDNFIRIWYSNDDDLVYFQTKAKSGAQATNIDQISSFALIP